ncbi:TIGR04282 family arsenosugar biosynthesis glycosyltransferase [Henriciella aquimarina]|uniref:TIGR04282 family arsenosugar biosynthesis glycosyltransferase n=1 Tax=Henriciella aquimarina TaxID=545261 RepID=UPI000A031A5A|nr:TIGR04282 family arsenosugar biosynthesis glycosyltransferase [Henriciella aquimarina]
MTKPTLLIFAKPPRMGLSKTRLAKDVGRAEARRIARFALAKTMQAARGTGWETRLCITPDNAVGETLGGLWPASLERTAQGRGNLGDRMGAAMEAAPHGPVLFIGTDAPGIRRRHIREAVRLLSHNGAVFGPADDGGFWLLGLSHSLRDRHIFDDVRWSGPHAMEDVWSNLPARAHISLLPRLLDIDTGKDWKVFNNQSSH